VRAVRSPSRLRPGLQRCHLANSDTMVCVTRRECTGATDSIRRLIAQINFNFHNGFRQWPLAHRSHRWAGRPLRRRRFGAQRAQRRATWRRVRTGTGRVRLLMARRAGCSRTLHGDARLVELRIAGSR
jgi:hypothetical protein